MNKYILAIDVGSTTTKAILFGPKDGLRLVDWTGAPTTVEKPHEDVIVGVMNSIRMLEKKSGRIMLDGNSLIYPAQEGRGVDLFVATSSAGGGLQMLVTGVMKKMTAESAHKAALGAGAIVTEVLAVDDGRTDLERIQRIQQIRPDMVLISGGINGGNTVHVTSVAEIVAKANPQSRLGNRFRLPVVYAGNEDAREQVSKYLKDVADVHFVDNLRPVLERENLEPTSNKIQQLFLEHVMSHAPGYENLIELTKGQLMATPNAVGELLHTVGKKNEINIMAVDIGGATTDVFSSMMVPFRKLDDSYMERSNNKFEVQPDVEIRRTFYRTVDANLGMSYSIGNVLAEASGKNIIRWLPFNISEGELRDVLSNKMIHPIILPQTRKAMLIEHAVAREAIRLAVKRHQTMFTDLKGVHITRSIEDVFFQENLNERQVLDNCDIHVIIGSGGVLSHTPHRNQALAILLDAFQPKGVTDLFVDSIFMMPHLGVMLESVGEDVFNVLKKDCLISLGTCIAPFGPAASEGKTLATVSVKYDNDKIENHEIIAGKLKVLPLAEGETALVNINPAFGYDCGEGSGKKVEALASGGSAGIILDGRGRPIIISEEPKQRLLKLREWLLALDAYEASYLEV